MENRKKPENDLLIEIKKMHHQMPRWVILIILMLIFIFSAYHAASLLIILLWAGIVAYLLSSIINKVESLGLKRNIAVAILYLFLAGLFIGAELLLSPYLQQEIKNFYESLPDISKQIETIVAKRSTDNIPPAEEIIRKLLKEVISPGILINKTLNFTEIFSQAASFLLGIVLIPFFVFFLLKDWPRILKTVMGWIPPVYVETTVSALSEINILVGKYLRGLIIDCFSFGIMATFGLWLLGINYPISLGILSGAANVIPYLGPIMACTTVSIITFIQFNSAGPVLNVILLYISLKLIDDMIIQPLTIGKSVELHPMLLVITIIIGEKLFGIIGMILAVPAVTIAQKVITILIESQRQPVSAKISNRYKDQGGTTQPGNRPL
jgi:predicted PurR-regulated permease PerM